MARQEIFYLCCLRLDKTCFRFFAAEHIMSQIKIVGKLKRVSKIVSNLLILQILRVKLRAEGKYRIARRRNFDQDDTCSS